MMTVSSQAIAHKAEQMQDSQRQEIKAALKAGAKLISLGRYSTTGNLVLRVTTPETWRGEVYDQFRHRGLSCLIPARCEQETQAWYARHTA